MSVTTADLYKLAELGMDAEVFKRSEVGQALIATAQAYADDAAQELKTVDPDNTKRIILLQNQIWRGESFANWISEIINEGREAAILLQEDRNPLS